MRMRKEGYKMNNPITTSHQDKELLLSDAVEKNMHTTANWVMLISAGVFGILWAATYLILGQMHQMWPMFNGEFPFLTARVFASQSARLPVAAAAISTFVDGALVGLVGSWLLLLPVKSRHTHYRSKP